MDRFIGFLADTIGQIYWLVGEKALDRFIGLLVDSIGQIYWLVGRKHWTDLMACWQITLDRCIGLLAVNIGHL